MKQAISILLFVIMCACGSSGSTEVSEAIDDPFYMFDDFPDSLFLGLYFAQPIEDSRKNLAQNKFELIDSSGAWRYWNQEDSNEVILSATEHLHAFKLIMKSSEILRSMDLLHDRFKRNATSVERSTDFSIYNYEQKTSTFKLSVFEQADLIRLNFEEQMRK
jgi:hypothetical protein